MKRWYVLQVYAGYENSVKTELQKRLHEEGLQDQVGDVLIPSAKMKQMFSFEEEKDEQLFPGYVLIEAELSPEVVRSVLSSPRVIRFLGGQNPVPLSKKEIDRVILQIRGELTIVPEKSEFVTGGEVEIKDGPFAGFVGIVDSVDQESERLTVMVSIFGRLTPVELGFNQVKQ
jgi:transcription termination/antitermination protein NusG